MMDIKDYYRQMLENPVDRRLSDAEIVGFTIIEQFEKAGMGLNVSYNVMLAIFRACFMIEADINETKLELFNRVLSKDLTLMDLIQTCMGGDSYSFVGNVVKMINSLSESIKEPCMALIVIALCVDGEMTDAEEGFLNNF